MNYYRLCAGLNDIGKLIPATESVYKHITDPKKDYYKSIFFYSEDQKRLAEEMIQTDKGPRPKGVAGIIDAHTNRIVFDLDSDNNIELAKSDAIEVCLRLMGKGVPEEELQINFSGKKGFSVEVLSADYLKPNELKNLAINLAGDLTTLDRKIYNTSRIIRVPLTPHQDTKLYKFPLQFHELRDYSVADIRQLAESVDTIDYLDSYWSPKKLSKDLIQLKDKGIDMALKTPVNNQLFSNIGEIDWSTKLPFLSPTKYALHCGLIPPGNRHEGFLILAATYKAVGFDKADAYRLLKAVAERQAEIAKQDRFSDVEIWQNILGSVYNPLWKGGSFGSEHPLLQQIEAQLPINLKRIKHNDLVNSDDVFEKFEKFAKDIDKNTLKFGLKTLDDSFMLVTGTSIGIVGIPGSGKSTIALDLIENNSKNGEPALFFSLDMNESLIASKMIQRVSGLSSKKIFNLVKENPDLYNQYKKEARDRYVNTEFFFRRGIFPEDIKNNIVEYEERTGKKVRLVVVDYLESVNCAQTNDTTYGPGIVTQQLTGLAKQLDVAMVILLQTQKSTNEGEAISSLRKIKGGSLIEQELTLAIGIHREGHPAKYAEEDFSMTVTVLKNRLGRLGSCDIKWDGARSTIAELSEEERARLVELRAQKKMDNDTNIDSW